MEILFVAGINAFIYVMLIFNLIFQMSSARRMGTELLRPSSGTSRICENTSNCSVASREHTPL